MLGTMLAGTAAAAALTAAGYQSMAPTGQWCGRTFTGLSRGTKRLALTYDDGPNDPHTQRLLEVLAKHDVRATFFLIGRYTKQHPDIYKSLVVVLASRLRETDAVVAASSFLPMRGRIARTLLELADNFGQDVGSDRIVIRQKFGQNDIGAMTGISRENVSRILNDWKRRKLVSRLSGYYCLENKVKLKAEAEL